MMEQNAIFMQDKNEFGTEELKSFKPENVSIYIRKSTHELKSWICICENAFSLRDFQKNLIKVHWVI